MAHAVTMIGALCVKLGISERVCDALPETRATREAQTNTKRCQVVHTLSSHLEGGPLYCGAKSRHYKARPANG